MINEIMTRIPSLNFYHTYQFLHENYLFLKRESSWPTRILISNDENSIPFSNF